MKAGRSNPVLTTAISLVAAVSLLCSRPAGAQSDVPCNETWVPVVGGEPARTDTGVFALAASGSTVYVAGLFRPVRFSASRGCETLAWLLTDQLIAKESK